MPPEKLDEEAIAELLDYARASHKPWAEASNINVIREGERMDQEVLVRFTQIVKQHKNFRNLANLDWLESQRRDPVIPTIINWIKRPPGDKRTLAECLTGVASGYEKCFYAAHQKEFVLHDNLLYLQVTPTNSQDSAPVFVVPADDRQSAIDACHRTASHQGRDRTLSLMKEHFWWPGMSQALLKAVANCGCCMQYEGQGSTPTDAAHHLHGANGVGLHRLRGYGSYGSHPEETRR